MRLNAAETAESVGGEIAALVPPLPVIRNVERDYWVRRLLALADMVAITAALALAGWVTSAHRFGMHVVWGLVLLPIWLVMFKTYGLYDRDAKRVSHSTVDDLPWIFHAIVVGALLMWLYFKVVAGYKLPLYEMLTFGLVGLVGATLLRWAVRAAAATALAPERVALLTGATMTKMLVRKMHSHPEYGLEPVGTISPAGGYAHPDGLPTLGTTQELDRIVTEHRIDRIMVSPTGLDTDDQLQLLRQSRELSIKVSILPQLFDAIGPAVVVDDVEGVTLLGMNPPTLSPSSRFLKRALDIIGAALLLLLLAPVMAIIAVAIKLDSRGPVLFKQKRIGRAGRSFALWKFRTMVPDAEARLAELRRFSKDPDWLLLDDDPRTTRVGRLLRHTSLDELPQLWNVVRGHMSLVGPRPLIESEDRLVDGWARSRLHLTPGITGSWQVLGRTKIPFEEMVKLDYLYVSNWSLWNDIRLIVRTLPVVLARRGAN